MIPFIDFDNDFLDTEALLFLSGASGGTGVEATATGNPLVFTTDLARPLKSLLIPFTPQQEGTGDPSPSNVRSIIPWNGLTVFGGGKNLLNVADRQSGYISSAGVVVLDNTNVSFGYVFLKANTVYTASTSVIVENIGTCLFETDKTTVISRQNNVQRTSITIPADTKDRYLRIWINYDGGTELNNKTDSEIVALFAPQIEAGQTATAYEPYRPITETDIVFPSPVYGGTLDVVSGVLTVTHGVIAKTWGDFTNKTSLGDNTRGTLNISSYPSKPSSEAVDAKCNIAPRGTGWSTDSIHFYTNEGSCIVFLPNGTDASTEIQIVYPLATPRTIQLTPQQITALVGDNTIWSDTNGDLTAVYLKKG